jgi:hypothetical protein
MPWPFTRKNNKNKRNLFTKSNQNLRRMAAQKAHFSVRSEFGRAGQSRVANLLAPSESGLPHNVVAAEEVMRTEQYYNQYKADALEQAKEAAVGISASNMEELRAFGESLRRQISSAAAAAQPTITITIPTLLARLLMFIIGAGLAFCLLFLLPLVVLDGGAGWYAMMDGALQLMWYRQEEGNRKRRAAAGTIQMENPMRRGENV